MSIFSKMADKSRDLLAQARDKIDATAPEQMRNRAGQSATTWWPDLPSSSCWPSASAAGPER